MSMISKNNVIKKLLIIISIILLCSCNIDVNYDFNEKSIVSTISSNFTLDEFFENEFAHQDEKPSEEELYDALVDYKSNMSLSAFNDSTGEYEAKVFNKVNNKISSSYSYEYNYDNFKDNYLFNSCFDNFEYSEDEEYYNFKLTGKCNCYYDNLKINISAKNGIENSNSFNIKDGVHSWDVYEEDNNIFFSIRKEKEVIKSADTTIRTIGLVVVIIIVLMTVVMCVIIKKRNE